MTSCTEAYFNPTTGRAIDVVHPVSERGGYSGLTLEELQEREGAALVRVSLEEAAKLQQEADRRRYCLPPVEESAAAADEALNVLPPFRWGGGDSWEAFAVGEPLTDRLLSWHVRMGRRWFTFNEDRATSHAELCRLVRESEAYANQGEP